MALTTAISVTMTLTTKNVSMENAVPEEDEMAAKVAKIVFPTVILLIAAIGICGNSLVIYVVAKHRDMHNVTNYFIANLSVTDIALLIICAIPTAANIAGWKITVFTCKSVTYMQFVTVQATCFTLAAMSVDRYYMIVHAVASRQKRTTFKVFLVCIIIWILSLLIHLPLAILSEITENNGCHPPFDDNEAKKRFYYLFMTFILYIIPLIVIVICYANILVLVWRKTTAGTESAQARKRSIKQKQKITKMVLIVVLIFLVSWGPTQCLLLWEKLGSSYTPSMRYAIIRLSALCLAYSNSCVNPFIYAFTTASFKKYFQGALSPCCRRSLLNNGESGKYHTKVPSDDTNNITTMSCVTKV